MNFLSWVPIKPVKYIEILLLQVSHKSFINLFKSFFIAVLIGRYTDCYMAENVKEYFHHVSNKVENIVRTVDGKRVYHVVMPYLENRVTWMKFISALINRRMRWEIWEN